MHRRLLFVMILVLLGTGPSASATAVRHHAAHGQATRKAGHGVRPSTYKQPHSRPARFVRATAHAAGHAPGHATARLVHGRGRHLHTAARLHHARRHGTAAVQAAAREAQRDAAENQQPLNEPANTASLNLPQIPLHVMNLPPMRGTHESLVRQNERADQEGLARIQDDADIATLLRNRLLVGLPVGRGLHTDPRLAMNRRYCRPFTARFLSDLSRAYFARFGSSLQVNSAVRTVEYQRHLLRVNGNAAPADGDIASPHLTGAAIDIGKKGLTAAQVAWMRAYLSPLESAGKLDVEEEFYQSCFHISVYQSYAGSAARPNQALLASRAR